MQKELDLQTLLKSAIEASQKARIVLLHYFGELRQVQEKAYAGLVSEADLESEKIITSHLQAALPGVGVLGEEEAFMRDAQGRHHPKESTWIVDPLDGTTNYIYRFPIFCSSIALQWKGQLVVGVVDVPMLNRTYSSVVGGGAFVNGERMKVSERDQIKNSFLATGFYPDDKVLLSEQLRIFTDLISEARGIRRAGSAAYDLCLVAEGVFDAFWETNLRAWDTAAGTLFVRESGGQVLNFRGDNYTLGEHGIVAGNPRLMKPLLNRIQASCTTKI